jgi:DNA processing protein
MKGLHRRTLALALALAPRIGGKTISRLLTRMELLGVSPEDFCRLSAEALKEEMKLGKAAADAWSQRQAEFLREAADTEARLEPLGVSMITAADAHYPARLEDLDSDPPGVIYVYGCARLLDRPTFGVFSSRGSSPEALNVIEQFADDGVLEGRVLVSGHDTPEYQRAAVVPLRWGAPRILVLDRGFVAALGEDLRDEPFRTARLWRRNFDPATDLAVSTIPPLRDGHGGANRLRDRVAAGLAERLDFASLSPGGNMHALARKSLAAGRRVRVWIDAQAAPELKEMGAQVLEAEEIRPRQ